jgi:hypothetical protein
LARLIQRAGAEIDVKTVMGVAFIQRMVRGVGAQQKCKLAYKQ